MTTGKQTRVRRLFAHSSERLCSIAVDHFIGYGHGLPEGLRHLGPTLKAIVSARPDAITMHKGIASSLWNGYAGTVPMILQSSIMRVDDSACEQIADPLDAIRLGADAIAVAAFVRGPNEAEHLRIVAEVVREAAEFELPVIVHTYPRHMRDVPEVSFDAEDIAWAVRCAVEVGVDVVKVPYCGDPVEYAQIVADCPLPLVCAGGPTTRTFEDALQMMAGVVKSGARGATIGRNVWGFDDVAGNVLAFKAVIHDGLSVQEALARVGRYPTAR